MPSHSERVRRNYSPASGDPTDEAPGDSVPEPDRKEHERSESESARAPAPPPKRQDRP
jgi:hypothetical protein